MEHRSEDISQDAAQKGKKTENMKKGKEARRMERESLTCT